MSSCYLHSLVSTVVNLVCHFDFSVFTGVFYGPKATTHLDKIPCAVLVALGSQAGVVDINHAFHLYYNVVCGLSLSQSQTDFEGFLRALRFPPFAK